MTMETRPAVAGFLKKAERDLHQLLSSSRRSTDALVRLFARARPADKPDMQLQCPLPGVAGEAQAVPWPETVLCLLKEAQHDLHSLLDASTRQIESLSREFRQLAGDAEAVIDLAGQIVGCAEGERVLSVVPRVHALSLAAEDFSRDRMRATGEVLEIVAAEATLLRRLLQLTRRQKAIARETEMLRVLTNIEVARLGETGAGFEYLARQLEEFAQEVSSSTALLARQTEERRLGTDQMRNTLAGDLPRMREQFAQIEKALEASLLTVDAALRQLRDTPLRLKTCISDIAARITGVIAAIQVHDVTRQQMEHVIASLNMLAASLHPGARSQAAEPLPALRQGIAIQAAQLRNVRDTVSGWTRQIYTCLEAIARIAAGDLLAISPMVLEQERHLAADLTRIEKLQQQCQTGDDKVQASIQGITGLMQLVREHLLRSRSVRERLQLLMFNSIVEASHLGARADGILEISRTIRRIAEDWSGITVRSEQATGEMLALVERGRQTLEIFTAAGTADLRSAQAETRVGLDILREAAECASDRGQKILVAASALCDRIADATRTTENIERGFRQTETIVAALEAAAQQMAQEVPAIANPAGEEQIERLFGALYTTETERRVLRAAMGRAELPAAPVSFAGNEVELF